MNPKTHPQGRPQKKRRAKKQGLAKQAPCPRSCSWPSDDANTDDDTGAHKLWDPHAGLKPSPLDDCTLDTNIKMEDDLPYGADTELSGTMVNMMVNLDDGDVRDSD